MPRFVHNQQPTEPTKLTSTSGKIIFVKNMPTVCTYRTGGEDELLKNVVP